MFVCDVRMKDSTGWYLSWTSPFLEKAVELVTLNAKMTTLGQEHCGRMVAASTGCLVQLWSVSDDGQNTREIGTTSPSSIKSLLWVCGKVIYLICGCLFRNFQPNCSCGLAVFHRQSVSSTESHWKSGSLACHDTELAGKFLQCVKLMQLSDQVYWL